MVLFARLMLIIYAVALIAGGAMGYVIAGSTASLIAGSVSGVLAFFSFMVAMKRPRVGFAVGLAVAGAVGFERFKSYLDSPADKPRQVAALVAGMSLVMVVILLLGIITRRKRR